MQRTWLALKEVISYVLRVQNYSSYLISSTIFGLHLQLEVPFSPREHFFPFHNNFAELSRVLFFHFALCVLQNTGELDIDAGMTCELIQHWNWKMHVLLHETEWLSKQQVLTRREQKWMSNETIISDTKIGNYRQRSRLTTENQNMLLRGRWKREGRWEVSMMKVTDKWDPKEGGC